MLVHAIAFNRLLPFPSSPPQPFRIASSHYIFIKISYISHIWHKEQERERGRAKRLFQICMHTIHCRYARVVIKNRRSFSINLFQRLSCYVLVGLLTVTISQKMSIKKHCFLSILESNNALKLAICMAFKMWKWCVGSYKYEIKIWYSLKRCAFDNPFLPSINHFTLVVYRECRCTIRMSAWLLK